MLRVQMRDPLRSARSSGVRTRPIAVDLFAGAGGMSLGFEQAGFDVVAAVEYDPVHAATHAFNFPQCEIVCRDVSKVTARDVLEAAEKGFKRMHPGARWPGGLDALIGGPPCQGFSSGGKREDEDARNALLLHFVRVVEEIRPLAVCLENVSGLLESKFDNVREEAFARLRAVGYELTGTDGVVNSLDFGVPQSRRRVIVLGSRRGAPSSLLPRSKRISVHEALDGLPSPSHYHELLESDSVQLSTADIERRSRTSASYAREMAGLESLQGDKSRPRAWDYSYLTGSRRTTHSIETVERFKGTKRGSVEPKSRLYRLPLDGPSRTLRAGTGAERGSHTSPRPIHPMECRVITVREAARLHGYPDWFRFHATNWHGHRQIGNSVPPPLARMAAHSLLETMDFSPRRLRSQIELGSPLLLGLSMSKAQALLKARLVELPAPRSRHLT